MVSPKKLHATVNCCSCKLLGADAIGVVTGAVGIGMGALFGDVVFVVGAVVVVVFGTVDTDGGTLLDVEVDDVSSPPLQFPVPQ